MLNSLMDPSEFVIAIVDTHLIVLYLMWNAVYIHEGIGSMKTWLMGFHPNLYSSPYYWIYNKVDCILDTYNIFVLAFVKGSKIEIAN